MEVVLCAGWAHMIYSAYITKNLSLYVKIIIYVCALHILKLINGDAQCTLNANFFFWNSICLKHVQDILLNMSLDTESACLQQCTRGVFQLEMWRIEKTEIYCYSSILLFRNLFITDFC